MLQGCSGPIRSEPRQIESEVVSPKGKLDFDWKLSGTRSIAPLQVFSDDQRIWLQWPQNRSMPVILGKNHEGEHVLTYQRQDPYTIIDGLWPRLIFKSGRQQAFARHVQSTQDAERPVDQVMPGSTSAKAAIKEVESSRLQVAPQVTASSPLYAVSPEDQNLRQTLVRWSGISGWYFQAEHWGVDVDIPLAGGAKFSDDFIASVQALVSSTELSDRPLQPCFYANQVLRVIGMTEPCDRTMAPAIGGAPA